MDSVLRYRGREVSSQDVVFISELIAAHPGASRRALSIKLCEAWGWAHPNGVLCDAVCRGLLLALHRGGHIRLPAARWVGRQRPVRGIRPAVVEIPATPLLACLRELSPVEIRQVRRTPEEALVNSLIEQHHYLGYVQPVGEHLKYLVTAQGRAVACFCWSSAPRHLGPRDRHIGWSQAMRKANISLVAYQSRFLILPWVESSAPGVAPARADVAAAVGRLAEAVRAPDLLHGDLRRPSALPGYVLPCGQLDLPGNDDGSRQGRAD